MKLDTTIQAAERLFAMQKKDGSFVSIIKPSGEIIEQPSRTRGILSAWALAEFGRFISNQKYIECAQKAFDFYHSRLSEDAGSVTPFNWVFMGQLSLSLQKNEKALEYARKILKNVNLQDKEKLEPPGCSLLAYIASFFVEISRLDKKYLERAIKISGFCYSKFEIDSQKNRENIELVTYSELSHTSLLLYEFTNDSFRFDDAKKISDWIMSNQMQDGSFCLKTGSGFAHSRSTASILESLVVMVGHPKLTEEEKKLYRQSMEKAISWLFSMQHDQRNICEIPEKIYSKISGGFRLSHDNSEIWLDAIAHFLLAITRLRKNAILNEISFNEFPQICCPLKETFISKKILSDNKKNPPLFLGHIFQWEIGFQKIIRKFFSRFSPEHSENMENMLGYENNSLRNYSYVLEALNGARILNNMKLENILKKTKVRNAPEFYEAFTLTNFHWKKNKKRGIKNCYGRGFGRDPYICLGKSIGEFLERYFHLYHKSQNKLLRASENELQRKKTRHVPVSQLSVFSQKQKELFSERFWDENSRFYWEKCRRYSTERETLIPAQLIYFGYKNSMDEPLLREKITSGLGGFFSKEEAILTGLYELIQRDSFLDYWLNKKTPEKIDLDSIKNTEFKKYCKDIEKNGYKLYFLYLPSPANIPTIISIIKDEKGGPYYSLGAGCDSDVQKALERSLDEAWSVYYYTSRYQTFEKEKMEINENFQSFITPLDSNQRLSLWANHKTKNEMDFFINGKSISFDEIGLNKKFFDKKQELDFVVESVEKLGRGYEVYVHLAKDKILKKLGFYSARVIVPQFFPLYLDEKHSPLNHQRLKNKNINPFPHPFP